MKIIQYFFYSEYYGTLVKTLQKADDYRLKSNLTTLFSALTAAIGRLHTVQGKKWVNKDKLSVIDEEEASRYFPELNWSHVSGLYEVMRCNLKDCLNKIINDHLIEVNSSLLFL